MRALVSGNVAHTLSGFGDVSHSRCSTRPPKVAYRPRVPPHRTLVTSPSASLRHPYGEAYLVLPSIPPNKPCQPPPYAMALPSS